MVRLQSHFPHVSTFSDFCFTCLLVMHALLIFFLFLLGASACMCLFFLFFCYLVVVLWGMGKIVKELFQIRMYAFVKSEIIRDHCALAGVQRGRKGAKLISFQITNG